ncbi:MAG TPA: contractile injection system protein, VgrG/Pvc8 family [Actinomycetota bacterium]|jgi:phage protein D|nr:contractile injection system protein, VgrG/Pvc8 family [Actinomycetota bacterium]
MTEAPVAVVSPVFTSGGTVVPELARDCVRLEVEEGLGGLRCLQLHLVAVGVGATGPQDRLLHLDGGTLDLGRELEVTLGSEGRQQTVFRGTVSALELLLDDGVPPVVVAHAEDALMALRMTRRNRTYQQVTDADVAAELAREHGLEADTDADGPRYDVVQQLNQSDLAFLRERARLIRAELWSTGRTLHFRSRPRRQGPELTLALKADLLDVRLAADLAQQRSEVVVTGYDADRREVVDERAGPEVVEAEVDRGRTGPRLVREALGASTTLRVREAALSGAEAAAWAQAEMLRRGRRFVTASGVTAGTPELVVGTRLTLNGIGEPFQGAGYYVTSVRHTFDLKRGTRTCFQAERASLNGAP